jgi:TP53 regulating kinase-like protein
MSFRSILLLSNTRRVLLKKGAEADLFLIDWYGSRAISKIRTRSTYRHPVLDNELRRQRTIREAVMLAKVKDAGIRSPYLYFLDTLHDELIMEYVDGVSLKDVLSSGLAFKIGECIGKLHLKNIIHGDVTTSNFILDRSSNGKNIKLVMIDFGLSFYSQRLEDMASDIRMFKEVLSSVHHDLFDLAYRSFIDAYLSNTTNERGMKILRKVKEIERRGRYSRLTYS